MKKHKFSSGDITLEFEEGKIYYIADWFPNIIDGKQYLFPILVECICITTDPEDWDYSFMLKEVRNLIPSDYPAKSYQNPNDIMEEDLKNYFFNNKEQAYKRFYKEFKEDKARFFNRIFEAIR